VTWVVDNLALFSCGKDFFPGLQGPVPSADVGLSPWFQDPADLHEGCREIFPEWYDPRLITRSNVSSPAGIEWTSPRRGATRPSRPQAGMFMLAMVCMSGELSSAVTMRSDREAMAIARGAGPDPTSRHVPLVIPVRSRIWEAMIG